MAEAKTNTSNPGAPQSQAPEQKFPSEIIDLPSGGKIYGKDSPLYDGKIEIKYMTAKEEDILTSANLIKNGAVLEKLMDSLILTPNITTNSLVLGDKNAIMVAIRILAYGPEYNCEVNDPSTGGVINHTFNLADCPFKELPSDVDYSTNEFDFTLPISKVPIKWRILTGVEEDRIDRELEAKKKIGHMVTTGITSRLKYVIVEFDGERDTNKIGLMVENLLSRDSLALRNEIVRVTPDIEMKQEVQFEGGETVEVEIPLTATFFWPNS